MKHPEPREWKSEELSHSRVADYKPFMFVDGEGVRCSLYVSGCLFACEGCFNRSIQNFQKGEPYTKALEDQIISDLSHDYVQGLTLLGGEPMLNTSVCLSLVRRIREVFGDRKDIWIFTGYTFEELLLETEDKLELLSLSDVLVDGRYDRTKLDLTLQFRGSRNQRILDSKRSLLESKAVIWEKCIDHTKYDPS